MHQHQSGFSLMELIVGVAIVGILATAAGPQITAFNDNNKLRDSARDFKSLILLARTEALKRGAIVNLTSTLEDDWSVAITVCEIPNNSGLATTSPCSTNDTVPIKTDNIGSNSVTIKSDGDGDPVISFDARGRLNGADVMLAFCDHRATNAGAKAKILTINATGRPKIEDLDITAGHSCNPT